MNVFLSEKTISEVETTKKNRFQGDHWNARNGIFIAHGPDIQGDQGMGDLSILEIAPTILYALGCDIPEKMDGTAIKDIFKKGSKFTRKKAKTQIQKKPIRDKEVSKEERKKIEERLRALGYLD